MAKRVLKSTGLGLCVLGNPVVIFPLQRWRLNAMISDMASTTLKQKRALLVWSSGAVYLRCIEIISILLHKGPRISQVQVPCVSSRASCCLVSQQQAKMQLMWQSWNASFPNTLASSIQWLGRSFFRLGVVRM